MKLKDTKYRRCRHCNEWIWSYQGKRFCNRSCASLFQHSHPVGRPLKRMEPIVTELRVRFTSTLGNVA